MLIGIIITEKRTLLVFAGNKISDSQLEYPGDDRNDEIVGENALLVPK
jgi:hypothetical protein